MKTLFGLLIILINITSSFALEKDFDVHLVKVGDYTRVEDYIHNTEPVNLLVSKYHEYEVVEIDEEANTYTVKVTTTTEKMNNTPKKVTSSLYKYNLENENRGREIYADLVQSCRKYNYKKDKYNLYKIKSDGSLDLLSDFDKSIKACKKSDNESYRGSFGNQVIKVNEKYYLNAPFERDGEYSSHLIKNNDGWDTVSMYGRFVSTYRWGK